MIDLRFTFALALVLGATALAQAPEPPIPPPPPGGPEFETHVAVQGGEGDFVYVRAGMGMQKLVKGAPYSAQAVTEFTQTLADGNRIHHTNTASMARDSEGRSRREESILAIGPMAGSGDHAKSIFIHDPVAGTSYVLEAESKTARSSQEPKSFSVEPGKYKMMTQRHMRDKASTTVSPEGHIKMEVQIKTEDLGTQVMEGLAVQGKRVTKTIPAGQIGNERPLEMVTETWYSEELQTIVMSKSSDPRTGETMYKLTNVSRAEPDPALFQVPADYKVTEGGEMGGPGIRVLLKHEE